MGNLDITGLKPIEREYEPNTVLYAQKINSTFSIISNLIDGIILALPEFYERDASLPDQSVLNGTSDDDVKEIMASCLRNILKYTTTNNAINNSITIDENGIKISSEGATTLKPITLKSGSNHSVEIDNSKIQIRFGSASLLTTCTYDSNEALELQMGQKSFWFTQDGEIEGTGEGPKNKKFIYSSDSSVSNFTYNSTSKTLEFE